MECGSNEAAEFGEGIDALGAYLCEVSAEAAGAGAELAGFGGDDLEVFGFRKEDVAFDELLADLTFADEVR